MLFRKSSPSRPGHFFGAIGLGIGLVGALMLMTVFVAKFAFGQDIGSRPMLLLGSFAALSSLQMICFGVMAEMLSRIYHQSSDHATYLVCQSDSVAPAEPSQSPLAVVANVTFDRQQIESDAPHPSSAEIRKAS